jgi:hypothetical protein
VSVYLARRVLVWLDQAQAVVDRHIVGADGACRVCGEVEPCAERAAAVRLLVRYGRLPRRRPGAALPSARPRCVEWFRRAG